VGSFASLAQSCYFSVIEEFVFVPTLACEISVAVEDDAADHRVW